MKSNKGITLVSLIASVLLVIILAATTIVTSMNAYNQMKFEGAKAELEEMQKLVDEMASDYQVYKKQVGDANASWRGYFINRYGAYDQYDSNMPNNTSDNHKFQGGLIANFASNSDVKSLIANFSSSLSSSSTEIFYFTEDDLVRFFGLKGIEPIVVDFATRTVYSVEGIKDSNDSNTVYYTPSQWGAKKIERVNKESDPIRVTAAKVANNNKFDVTLTVTPQIKNITEVYYKKGSGNFVKVDNFRDITNYTTNTTNTSIRVTVDGGGGSYIFRVVDELGNSADSTGALSL